MKKSLPIVIAIVIAVVAGAFVGGLKYGQAHASTGPELDPSAFGGMQGAGGLPQDASVANRAFSGNMVSGEITAVDGHTLTISLPDGTTQKVVVDDSAQITKQASGTVADLTVGETIVATGTENEDGSVSADTIRLGEGTLFMNGPQTVNGLQTSTVTN